jgi:PAS domain S-box-containing protein
MPESKDPRRAYNCSEDAGVSSSAACDSLPTLDCDELRKTLESVGDGFFACDGDWKFIYLNSAAENLIGINRSDAIGRNHWECFPQMLGTEMEKEYRLAAAGQVRHFEFLSPRCGRWFESRCFPRQGGGISVVFRDISERKQAETDLRESEARFRSLFEHSMDAMFLTFADGRIIAANPAACAMFGMTEEEICRAGRAGLVDPEDQRVDPALQERRRTGKARTELHCIRKDGTKFDVEVSSVILDGNPRRAFVVMHDITERKRTQELLIRSEKVAALGRMAASLAHEINNPLAAAMNSLFLAQSAPECSDSVRQHLGITDQELRRISHITRQALGFYREGSNPTAVALSSLLDETVDLFKSRIKAKHATIKKLDISPITVTAVAGELRQIFSNLLSNSLDAIDERGTVLIRLSSVRSKDGADCARITFADNGRGIQPDLRTRIFEPLFTTKGPIGTGLGLWVSKQLIEKNRGAVRVHSSVSGNRRGTTFSVMLPVTGAAQCQRAG